MKWSQNIDNQIKYAVNKEAEKMKGEQQLYCKIREQIYIKGRRKNMENKKVKNKFILVGAMTMVLAAGTTLLARIVGWDMKLTNIYERYSDMKQIKEKNKFSPKFVEELPGGYRFMMASEHKGELIDKYNKTSDEGNELILRYFAPGEEEQMHAIVFLATDIMEHYSNDIRKNTDEYRGITLEFADWKVKYVSNGYKITEEEQRQIEDGILFIKNTEDEELLKQETDHNQQISWREGEIGYTILSANNYEFTQEEFIEMAKKVIDAK